MLKISEFAKLANTTRRTLIFYDEKGLFSPAKIAPNGYRYYEPDQLYQFELIAGLRNLGLSLEDIKKILSSNGQELEEYLVYYQRKNRERIRQLELLDKMLAMHRKPQTSFEQLKLHKIKVISTIAQEFWCTDFAADCTPDEVAKLYSKFMKNLGDVTSKTPSQLGFLTDLAIDNGKKYMNAGFRFIKEVTALDNQDSFLPKIIKPSADYLSIKVKTNLEDITSGLEKLAEYAKSRGLKVDNKLWQLNTDQYLVKIGSSAEQVLQYRILK